MRAYFARKAVEAFGARYNYDISYMLQMLKVSPAAFHHLGALAKLAAHREKAPVNAFYAAKIVGAVTEDCGPCVQLVVDMAREAGMPPASIEAVLKRDLAAMDVDTVIGFRFAAALVRRVPEEDDAREAVRQQWGEAGVIELPLAVQVGRVFPMIKAGMGYAKSCQRVQVGDQPVEVSREAA